MGKGSRNRTADHKAYAEGHARIFGRASNKEALKYTEAASTMELKQPKVEARSKVLRHVLEGLEASGRQHTAPQHPDDPQTRTPHDS